MAGPPDDPDASAPTVALGPAEPATSPTILAPPSSPSKPAEPATTPRPRTVYDSAHDGLGTRYSLGATLGRGGMGVVLLAHDERVGRDVAIKLLRCEGEPPPEAVSRFLREARVQGRLDHPAVVPVHDLGADDRGVPYFAMKRLTGTTLATILDRLAAGDLEAEARWPRRLLLARLADLCLAVHFAHTRGVVHRDLKPHNVMLGDFGEVYVLDWGIAKIADDDLVAPSAGIHRGDLETLDSVSGATAAGAVLGTPGYMPPEQLRGGAIDHRVDVYALGCLLFEILALEAALPRGAAAFDPALATAALRPAARRPDAEIPPELDDATATATAPDPKDRFSSARDLHDAIRRYLDGDRDLARRRELAAEHALAATRALDGGSASRPTAMREAGRALALDPGNQAAQALVGRILLEPPSEIPPAVEQAIEDERARAGRAHLKIGGWAYLSFFLFIPALAVWVHVRDWTVPLITLGLAAINSVLTFVMARTARALGRWLYVALVIDAALVGTVGIAVCPLLLLPMLAVISTMTFLGQPMSRRRNLILVMGAVATLWPLVGEWIGLLPSTYRFVDGALVIRPWVIDMAAGGTTVMLLGVTLSAIFAGGAMVIHLRIAQEEAERRVHLLAWHLQQLVPERVVPEPTEPSLGAPARVSAPAGAASATPTATPPPPSPARTRSR